jgi:hypothetical protein
MFQSAVCPIRDMMGDDTIVIVSTPCFPESPLPTTSEQAEPNVNVCRRLFEKSSIGFLSEWTTDSSSNE